MWSIRVLTGPQTGQFFPLKKGKNRIGRSPVCDIRLASNGVSKEHCEVSVFDDKILITDLRSSNGTLLNGAKVQNSIIRIGDKIGLHDIIFDIIPTPHVPKHQMQQYPMGVPANSQMQTPNIYAPPQHPPGEFIPPQHNEHIHGDHQASGDQGFVPPNSLGGLAHNIKQYIENVALPGVYKLAEWMEFRYVLGLFVLLFMVLVTSLSVVPMIQITKESIQKESRRRALTIARNLAAINQQALIQGVDSALSVDSTRLEEGVSEAVIVSHTDGSIIAPPERAGKYLDLAFITEARRQSREYTTMIGLSKIGASVPISQYNPELGGFSIRAHAIVVYDMGTIAVDGGRTLSLFIQIFIIATLLGSILYYFLLKLIEYPIRSINEQVDKALREKRDDTKLNFQFPVFQTLISNINSALSRAIHGNSGDSPGFVVSRETEAENVVQLIGYPCIAINKDYLIISSNPAFEMLTGASLHNIQNQELSSLPDQALQKNIDSLLDVAATNIAQIASDQLEFGGDNYLLSCQAVSNSDGTPEYYLVTISPLAEADGGAA